MGRFTFDKWAQRESIKENAVGTTLIGTAWEIIE
jgi:hypothetical protein